MAKKEERVFLRLPLKKDCPNHEVKTTIDRGFIFIHGVDPDKLKQVMGWYTPPMTNVSHWNRYIGYENILKRNPIEQIPDMLQNMMQQLLDTYPVLGHESHPFYNIFRLMFNLKDIIEAAACNDIDDVEDALQQYTYLCISQFSDLLKILDTNANQAQWLESMSQAFESMPKEDLSDALKFSDSLFKYSAAIEQIMKFKNDFEQTVLGLEDMQDQYINDVRRINGEAEQIDADFIDMVLTVDKSEVMIQNVLASVTSFDAAVKQLETDRLGIISILEEAQTKMSHYNKLLDGARSCAAVLGHHIEYSGHNVALLVATDLVTQELADVALNWYEGRAHEHAFWQSIFASMSQRLNHVKYSVSSSYDTTKLSAWKSSMKQYEVQATEQVSVSFPAVVKGTQSAATYSDKVISNLEDLFELVVLYAAARTDSANANWSITLRSARDVLKLAGFNLDRIKTVEFREFLQQHSKVHRVDDVESVKHIYKMSRKALLLYRIENAKSTPASRERLKITQLQASLPILKSWEDKWGVTREQLLVLGKQRNQAYANKLNDSKVKSKQSSAA